MKIEKVHYVLTYENNGETRYLNKYDGLVDDICEALMFKSNIVAANVKGDCVKEYSLYLDILPVKITYEWE